MGRLALPVAAAVVLAVVLWVVGPRLGHTFPSMVDDWAAISRSADELPTVLRLGNPEELRYRPAWIVWNYLQWHTLGAPGALTRPVLWELLRIAALVLGLMAAGAALSARRPQTAADALGRAVLVGGAIAAVVTIPAIAVDLARYGPQEPLMVGLMCAGGALIAAATRRAVERQATVTATAVVGGLGVVLWWFGVGQKESSLCALALAPFLWLAVRPRLRELSELPHRVRATLWATVTAAALAFVPMLARTIQLATADERVYGAEPEHGIVRKAVRELTEMGDALDSRTGWILVGLALALTLSTLARRRVDWLAFGLLATALSFLVFAGTTEVTASRYYLPTLAAAALVVTRVGRAPHALALGLATVLILVSALQVPDARRTVASWVSWEQRQESMVREAARREAAGCRVAVTGPDVELVTAFPVLLPLAREKPGGCGSGESFVLILTGTNPWDEDPRDPVVVSCGADAVEVLRTDSGRMLRCATTAN